MSEAPHPIELARWPASRIGELVPALAREAGIAVRASEALPVPEGLDDGPGLSRWVEDVADWLGVEAEPTHVVGAELARLHHVAPAILRWTDEDGSWLLALVRGSARTCALLTPQQTLVRCPTGELRDGLSARVRSRAAAGADLMLASLPVSASRGARIRQSAVADAIASRRVAEGWVLRPASDGPLGALVARSRAPRYLGIVLATHVARYALFLLAWWLIGSAAIEGRAAWGWLLAWAAVLLTLLPLQVVLGWAQGQVAIRLGAVIRQRLLVGTLRLRPDETRSRGVGQFMSVVLESEAFEALALSGGLGVVTGAIELVFAGAVLGLAADGGFQVAAMVFWSGALAWLIHRLYARRRRWTGTRLELTHGLIERMVGHRTRLVQERPERWHVEEDEELESYAARARELDGSQAWLGALASRGWLLLAIATLAPGFVVGTTDLVTIAVRLGGVLLAAGAFEAISRGLSGVATALIAWESVRPVLAAAARPVERGAAPATVTGPTRRREGAVIAEATELTFGYPERAHVLRGCSFSVATGDHVLLEGPSGSGKSTIASLLAGLRRPSSGLLLLGGVDLPTLGTTRWRRRAVSVPQFHENHVFAASLGFNLLMGRSWPPSDADIADAEAMCVALGLGPLLERMPSGLDQLVGEGGWQLSHGERSRVFVARALLQDPDLVVLDESLAALDPDNLERCMEVIRRRASTLVVIAHP